MLLPCLLIVAAAGLHPSRADDEPERRLRFSEVTSVTWVLVPVVVRDKAGYVQGLDAGDFRLWVDGQEVAIESFESGRDVPVSLVHLQDISGSMANGSRLDMSREALRFFLGRLRPGSELAVASFASGRTQVEVPFTDRAAVVEEAMAVWEGYGTTALHDAVAWLPEIHLAGRNHKRAAVLVTDGVDNASVISPAVARDLVRRAEIPVYVLALRQRTGPEASAITRLEEASLYAALLRRLAAATGGRYYSIRDPGELRAACTGIADELRHQYVLGFQAAGGGPTADHRLRVEVGKKQTLRVSHRLGYRGTSPAAR